MPIRSRSQYKKYLAMVRSGEMSKEEFNEMVDKTPGIKQLPSKVRSKRAKGKRKK